MEDGLAVESEESKVTNSENSTVIGSDVVKDNQVPVLNKEVLQEDSIEEELCYTEKAYYECMGFGPNFIKAPGEVLVKYYAYKYGNPHLFVQELDCYVREYIQRFKDEVICERENIPVNPDRPWLCEELSDRIDFIREKNPNDRRRFFGFQKPKLVSEKEMLEAIRLSNMIEECRKKVTNPKTCTAKWLLENHFVHYEEPSVFEPRKFPEGYYTLEELDALIGYEPNEEKRNRLRNVVIECLKKYGSKCTYKQVHDELAKFNRESEEMKDRYYEAFEAGKKAAGF